MKNLLIGYGNSLRRDDGVGPFVAGRFRSTGELDVIACHQLTPELAEPVGRAAMVVFVDAHAVLPPGKIVVEKVLPRPSPLIHRLDPGALLDLSRELFGRVPEGKMVQIGGESFDLGEGLSPAMEQAAQQALDTIRELLNGSPAHHQANQEQDQEDHEQDLRDPGRRDSNPSEPENGCQDGNH